jgi:hypothetical protein
MLFGLEQDDGSAIKLYVVPDSGGTAASVRLRTDGVDVATVTANEHRVAIVNAGRHTGMVGFNIDESVVPGLAGYADLEILDANTGIVIYRRRTPSMIEDVRMFRLETHLLPLWRIDDSLRSYFQFWYKGIDRQGLETSIQTFCTPTTSSFMSGRLLVKNFEFYLAQGIKAVAMFRDPYDELAERLIILKNVGLQSEELLGPRDALTFEPVIAALQEIEQFDEASLKRFFKRAPQEVFSVLANPFVRQMTCATSDEMPNTASVATALGSLAAFEIVGLRSEATDFSHGVCQLLGIEDSSVPVMSEYSRVTEVGARLRQIRDVEMLLERDLELHFHVANAFASLAS